MNRCLEWEQLSEPQKLLIITFQQSFPVKVGSLATELGAIVKKATLQAGISGEIKLVDGHVEIRVNRHDVLERQRFTLAHEIAHFLLHKDKIGDGIIDDVLYRSKLSDELESEANKLAAEIIMPWNLIQSRLATFGNPKITEQNIETMALEAQVSKTAMKIRLGKL